MKTTSSTLLNSERKVKALRITRTDGQVFGFTESDVSAVIGGVTYSATSGLTATSIETSAGLAVDNLELTTLNDGSLFTAADIATRRWSNAAFLIFWYDWGNLAAGTEALLAGTLGEVESRNDIAIELRGLQQFLQQAVGNVSTKTCRAHLADFPTQNQNNRCGLSAAAWTVTATVTAVTSRQLFTASGLAQSADWFGEGLITFTTGANAGLSQKIKAHAAGGVLTLLLPMVLTVAVGDAFSIIAGCRGRLDEDCAAKFNNVLNFQGEPHRPTLDDVTASPVVDV